MMFVIIIQIDIYFSIKGLKCILSQIKGHELTQLFHTDHLNSYKMETQLKRSAICYSEYGFKKSDKYRIYEWSFKCLGIGDADMIGIVSSLKDINRFKVISETCGDSYCWWSEDINWSGIWRKGNGYIKKNSKFNKEWLKKDTPGWDYWIINDIITVILDTNKWTLTFLKNYKMVFDEIQLYEIDDDSVWYPFISIGNKDSMYSYQYCVKY